MASAVSSDQEQFERPTAASTYKFSHEELRALKECNRESFYYRCVPFGTFLGLGVHFAVKAGYLSASAKYGSIPKVCAAVAVGYFVGKFSYQQKCVEKIMALPNSQLAEMLRKKRGRGALTEVFSLQEPLLSSSPGRMDDVSSEATQFTDVGDTRPMNAFDSESSIFGGVDYSENETQMKVDSLPAKPKEFTDYDTLRKSNRDNYEVQRLQQVDEAQKGALRRHQQMQQQQPSAPSQPAQGRKNIYGDVWDKTE